MSLDSSQLHWGPVTGNLNNFMYNPDNNFVGINPDIFDSMYECEPFDFFSLFVDNTVVDFLVTETNRYAQSKLKNVSSRFSRISKWYDTDRLEMKNLLGLILWMSLNPLPSLAHYWRQDFLYSNNLNKVMPRNRFELLLSVFHCGNNANETNGNR